jgi:hypothetical protein
MYIKKVNKMSDKKIEFLYQSINDTQATIRAIDVKIGFLFVIIFLPLAAIKEIVGGTKVLWASDFHYGFAIIITAVTWLISLLTIFSCVKVLSNVDKHIKGTVPKNVFYSGGIPTITIKNLLNLKDLRTSHSIDECITELPVADDEIIKQLMSEKIKVSLIREFKGCKAKLCMNLILIWLCLGMVLSALYNFGIGINQ